ncbi:hypothetical protein CFP65_4247 [Kitasatospora sp. MMS16-BH015]|uniref:DUF6126 family protein n=1 Tax=Kitasatospora sp. MMS16-BH015 TaxID=2018025 RepID=UPI000CA2C8D3|nr:DUF6126 family protein [Kitasatospora sp. MMS16-BH015]AUG79001.1 hypothetical protein CFP65_4247 [Kitasatospora sp. MMS16-BH015]
MTQETIAPAGPLTTDAGRRTDNRVWIRAAIYIGATHFFAGFVILLFELGSRK